MANQIQLSDVQGYALTKLGNQLAVSNVQGYALTTPVRPLTLRQLPVYVMGSPATSVGIRALLGYVMGASLAPLPKGVTGLQAVLQLVVKKAKTANRPTSDFTLAAPTVLANDNAFNTTVRATATAQSGLAGSKLFRYNRLDLSRLVDNPSNFDLGTVATIYALLPTLNAYTGLTLTTDDLVDGPIDPNTGYVTLTAKATSWFFIPGTQLSIGKTLLPINSVATTDTINW